MNDLKKHRIYVQAALVSLTLAGCSNVNTTKEPSVREAVAQITSADNSAEELPWAPSGRSVGRPSVRSNSVWISCKIVQEPAAQGVQGHLLQANNKLDMESTRQSQSSKRVMRRPERPKVASRSRRPGSVGDALDKVLSGRSAAKDPTVMNAVEEVITATEIADDDNTDEEPSTK